MPEPPSFPETITLVRDRVRKIIGRVSVPSEMADVRSWPHNRLIFSELAKTVGQFHLEMLHQEPCKGHGIQHTKSSKRRKRCPTSWERSSASMTSGGWYRGSNLPPHVQTDELMHPAKRKMIFQTF